MCKYGYPNPDYTEDDLNEAILESDAIIEEEAPWVWLDQERYTELIRSETLLMIMMVSHQQNEFISGDIVKAVQSVWNLMKQDAESEGEK